MSTKLALCAYQDDGLLLMLPRLITYQFMHANLAHFAGNFLFFLAPALYLEKRLGKLRFLATYLLCGAAGALMFILIQKATGAPNEPLLGASGSIFGVITMALIVWGKEDWWKAVVAVSIAGYVVLPQLLMSFLDVLMPNGVCHQGHLGGMIFALFLGNFFRSKKH